MQWWAHLWGLYWFCQLHFAVYRFNLPNQPTDWVNEVLMELLLHLSTLHYLPEQKLHTMHTHTSPHPHSFRQHHCRWPSHHRVCCSDYMLTHMHTHTHTHTHTGMVTSTPAHSHDAVLDGSFIATGTTNTAGDTSIVSSRASTKKLTYGSTKGSEVGISDQEMEILNARLLQSTQLNIIVSINISLR